jgi:AAA15 family ATPase/GTPase
MLLQFNVQNYKSIEDEVTIDLTAAGNLRDHPDFIFDCDGLKVLPVAALYGNNASGKTNIVSALLAMCAAVHQTGSLDDARSPFLFSDAMIRTPNRYEMIFVISGKEYQYGFALAEEGIEEEWLYARKVSEKAETKWKKLLERQDHRFDFGSVARNKKMQLYANLLDRKLLALPFLANRVGLDTQEFTLVQDQIGHIAFQGLYPSIDLTVSMYRMNSDLLERASSFIRQFDAKFETLQVRKRISGEGREINVLLSVHDGNEYSIGFESAGTQKLIAFCCLLFSVLSDGGILVVDELDCQLHPLIMRRIVRMFHDKETNPKGAQLIFSSHNLIVLNRHDLRRDEIWFVEKDAEGRTSMASLAEYRFDEKRFRADSDYSKNYLAGLFGAIPYQDVQPSLQEQAKG